MPNGGDPARRGPLARALAAGAAGAHRHRPHTGRNDNVLTPIEDALRRIRRGEMVLVVDDEDRENEGDLTMAAEWVTPEAVNFMLRWARGLVCTPCDGALLDALCVPPMVPPGSESADTAFCVSIDHRDAGSGIGAADRAHTIRRMLDPSARPDEFVRPGHVFPLRARRDGVLARRGHTEAAVDLARLAGLTPAAVICEVLHDDGSPARLPYLGLFCQEHRIPMISVEQVVDYVSAHAAQEYVPARGHR
jgi:3,4-dihydroxy-2-butanone 4-phosphate synthase